MGMRVRTLPLVGVLICAAVACINAIFF